MTTSRHQQYRSLPLSGIIQDMTEVKQMYKITRYVDSDDNHKPRAKVTDIQEAINNCSNRYADKRPWRNRRKCANWLENAMEHKFVKVVGTPESGYYLKVVHGRGMQLIAKTWLIHRKGLREITMKEYKHTREMYKVKYVARVGAIGIIVGAIIGAVGVYLGTRL